MNFRSVLYIIGLLISTLGCMMIIPALFDLFNNHNNWSIFASTGIIIFLMGITIILAFKNKSTKIGNRETFLLSVLSWIFLAGISALPLYLSDLNLSYTDAFFEATKKPVSFLIWISGIAFAAYIVGKNTDSVLSIAVSPIYQTGILFTVCWFLIR